MKTTKIPWVFAVAFGAASLALGQNKAVPLPPEGFDTPQAAADALLDAAAKNDKAALVKIFGSPGRDILTSGDPNRDEQERAEFTRLAQDKHALEPDPMNKNRETLTIGDEDWPFPAPIVQRNGKWSFEPGEARTEMRARRVGADELDVVEVCAGYVEAQQEYAAAKRGGNTILEYARRVASAPGKRDGLTWDGPEPLVPRRFAEAVVDEVKAAGGKPKPYHGYYFRMLTAQGTHARGGAFSYDAKGALIGGFGLAAWPAAYGVTGIHTFIVNQDGVIYEKDLGPASGGMANPIKAFDPDSSWKQVE